MKKALTTEEWIAKRRARAAQRGKRSTPPKEIKRAGVTIYRSHIDIHSHAVYGAAYPDPNGYREYWSPSLTAQEIGREVRAALLASRFITPEHPEWDDVIRIPTNEEIKAWQEDDKARAGVKTLQALFNGAGHVSLTLQDGQMAIHPLRYRGRGHWEGIPGQEDTVLPENVPDAVFGAAILDALGISRAA